MPLGSQASVAGPQHSASTFLYGPQLEELDTSQGPPPTDLTLFVWHCICTTTNVQGGGIMKWYALPPQARDALIALETQRGRQLADNLHSLDPH